MQLEDGNQNTKRKTLIHVDRYLWGQVKEFATIKDISLNSAVELLLVHALNGNKYSLVKEEEARK
jgi:hypothetical protein